MLEIFIKSLMAGFTISAIMGPIGILFIEQMLKIGLKGALPVILSAPIANGIYGAIAAFGISIISNFLLSNATILKIVGGLFLLYLAYREFKSRSIVESAVTKSEGPIKLMFEVILLTLTNPINILFFVSIFANISKEKFSLFESYAMVLGIFLGSVVFYLLLGIFLAKIKRKLSQKWIFNLKCGSAILIGLFGLFSIASGLIELFA
jgi:putative LysE/RhtB family amino acid efflux pump